MVRGSESQKRPMGPPVSHIEIAASPLVEPFLFVFWKMGMTEDDDLKSLHKLPMSKGFEGRRRMRRLSHVVLMVAHAVEPSGDEAGNLRACQMNETIGPWVLQHPSKSPILPLLWIG